MTPLLLSCLGFAVSWLGVTATGGAPFVLGVVVAWSLVMRKRRVLGPCLVGIASCAGAIVAGAPPMLSALVILPACWAAWRGSALPLAVTAGGLGILALTVLLGIVLCRFSTGWSWWQCLYYSEFAVFWALTAMWGAHWFGLLCGAPAAPSVASGSRPRSIAENIAAGISFVAVAPSTLAVVIDELVPIPGLGGTLVAESGALHYFDESMHWMPAWSVILLAPWLSARVVAWLAEWAESTAVYARTELEFPGKFDLKAHVPAEFTTLCVLISEAAEGMHARRVKAAQAMQRAERFAAEFTRLFHQMRKPALLHDLQGRITDVNPALLDILGGDAGDYVGRLVLELAADEETRQAMLDEYEQAIAGSPSAHHVYTLIGMTGREKTFKAHTTIIQDDEREPGIALCVGENLSEDLSRAETEIELHKTLALGQLTAGIAHDFNNLLAIVAGNVSFLRRRTALGQDEKIAEVMADTESAVRDAAALTALLSGKAGAGADGVEPLDVESDVRKLIAQYRGELTRNPVEVSVDSTGPLLARIAPSALSAITLNVLRNAAQASPEGAPLTVALRSAGDSVEIVVEDRGKGMSREVRKRAFDPYFTTRTEDGGRGLGLWMVRNYLEQAGGSIAIDSRVGHGTTVAIRLPRVRDGAARTDGPATSGPAAGGDAEHETKRCLVVVDDDTRVRRAVARMLEGDGRPVVQFASADEALPWLNVHLPRVDAVVSDAVMPGVLDGKDLAVEMGRARPDLPFILLTGFTEHAPQAAKAAAGLQFFRMLNKPYDADELLAVLKQLEHARLKADNTQLSRPDLEPTG